MIWRAWTVGCAAEIQGRESLRAEENCNASRAYLSGEFAFSSAASMLVSKVWSCSAPLGLSCWDRFLGTAAGIELSGWVGACCAREAPSAQTKTNAANAAAME